jgi:8-oxo-dGTP diphosphatase
MHYKVGVKGIVRRAGGDILIVKRSDKDDYLPSIWETVGGGMDDELVPQEALKREIKEEAGIEVKVGEPFNVFPIIKDNGEKKIGITFLCEYLGGDIVLSDEHSEYKWINPATFKQYKSIPSLYIEIANYSNRYTEEHEKFTVSQKAILIRNGKCLIAEINKRPGIWDLPGGRINVGENKEEALRREIKEELGIDNFKILSAVHYDAWYTSMGWPLCGIANMISSDEEITLSVEHTNLAWINEKEIDNYKFIWPEMSEMIKRGFKLANN